MELQCCQCRRRAAGHFGDDEEPAQRVEEMVEVNRVENYQQIH